MCIFFVGFCRATCSCAAHSRLFKLVITQNRTLRANPRPSQLSCDSINDLQIRFQFEKKSAKVVSLKGQCHEIFDFCFFSWISFPQSPEYNIRAVKIFFENSRWYSQLKVHHRCRWHQWQMDYFVWTPWEVELTYRYIFAFKFTLRPQQTDFVPIICHRCRWYQWCTLTCEYLREFSKNQNGPNGIL